MPRIIPLILALLLGAVPAAQAAETAAAQTLVMETTQAVLARLRAENEQLKADPSGVYTLVEDLVLPHFDFERMSQWVLGKHWRDADETQRGRFTDAFRTLLVRTYAVALLEYNDQQLEFPAARLPDEAPKVLIKSEIRQSGAPPIPLHYRLYDNQGRWLVYDISVDGVSLVANYRTSFGGEVATQGLDALIERLEQMNREKGGEHG